MDCLHFQAGASTPVLHSPGLCSGSRFLDLCVCYAGLKGDQGIMRWLRGNQGPGDWATDTPGPGGAGSSRGSVWRWVGCGACTRLLESHAVPCPHSQQLLSSSYPLHPTPTPSTDEPTSLRSGKIPFPLTLKRKKLKISKRNTWVRHEGKPGSGGLGSLQGALGCANLI